MKLFSQITILFILCVCLNSIKAQQLPLYHFYRDHWGLVNPSGVSSNYLGFDQRQISISATARQQWLKIPEAPKTQLLSFEYVDDDTYHFSSGFHVINDQTGAIGQTGVYGNIAYRIDLGDDNILAGGISAGGVQYHLDLSEVLSGSDNVNALSLAEVNTNQFYYDVGLGITLFLKHSKYTSTFYGISAPQTFGLNTAFKAGNNEYAIVRQRHIYLNSGVYHFFDNKKTRFLAGNLWGRYLPNTPVSMDASLRYYNSMGDNDEFVIWFGVGGGLSKIIQAEFGIGHLGVGANNNALRLGIGYSQFVSKLNNAFGRTIDLNLTYAIQK